MTDTSQQPKRKLRRWAVLFSIVVLLGVALLRVRNSRKSVLERAASLQIGQPISEVERFMGGTGYVVKVGTLREIRLFGLEQTMQAYAAEARKAVGNSPKTVPAIDDWPVVVHFDPRDGRVFRFKRGDEWFGTTSAP